MSDMNALNEVVISVEAIFDDINRRLSALERHSHEPFDFTHLIERLAAVEAAVRTPSPSIEGTER